LEKHSRQILAVIGAQPDLTLDEIVSALRKRRIRGSRSALSRFFRSPCNVHILPGMIALLTTLRGGGLAA
jgi:hypothetical protein